MKGKIFLIGVFCFLSLCSFSQKQEASLGDNVLIVTKSGEVYRGVLLTNSDLTLELETEDGNFLSIRSTDVDYLKALKNADSEAEIQKDLMKLIPLDDYNSNRYFLSPSGYSIPKGKSYYENIAVFFNSFGFGVSDNFSLAVGTEIISTLYGHPIIYLSPRFHVMDDKGFAWSLGATFLTLPSNDFEGIGIVQTSFTIGDRNNNFTLGGGIGFSTDSFNNGSTIPLTFSGVTRLSKKVALVTDNFLIMEDTSVNLAVFSAGVRLYVGDKGAAVNLALWRSTEDQGGIVALPFVSFALPMK